MKNNNTIDSMNKSFSQNFKSNIGSNIVNLLALTMFIFGVSLALFGFINFASKISQINNIYFIDGTSKFGTIVSITNITKSNLLIQQNFGFFLSGILISLLTYGFSKPFLMGVNIFSWRQQEKTRYFNKKLMIKMFFLICTLACIVISLIGFYNLFSPIDGFITQETDSLIAKRLEIEQLTELEFQANIVQINLVIQESKELMITNITKALTNPLSTFILALMGLGGWLLLELISFISNLSMRKNENQ